MAFAERDGVSLYYERAGAGPELLFLPGWCSDESAFAPQFEHFARTHAVTTLVLRGCGRSSAPPDGYDIPALADDVTWFCETVGIVRPVVVGHSLGGMVAVELGARHPGLPRALVGVDPGPLDATDAARELFARLADDLGGPDGEAVRRAYVGDMGARDESLAVAIVEMMCAPPLAAARAVIDGVVRWQGADALARCPARLLVILASPAPGGSNEPARLLRLKPDAEIAVTVGSGHFNQLEVPDQVNAMLERFLSLV